MFTRQKVVFSILHAAGRPLNRTTLVKLIFLLRRETVLKEETSFYDFVPYKYGPFSFALYRDLETLEREGCLSFNDEQISIQPGVRVTIQNELRSLPFPVREAVDDILKKYGRLTPNTMLKTVYERYPWYAVKSERTDLVADKEPCPVPYRPAVYTMGYQERSVDGFFDELLRKGIRVLFDIRSNPVSRKYGFARKSMSDIAGKLDLEYHHVPELGIPSEERSDLSDYASYQRLLDAYAKQILPRRKAEVTKLASAFKNMPSVLICMEKDVRTCHRSRLASAISSVNGLPVIHL